MSTPTDITDPVVAKAFAHPLRIQILSLLENRVASPVQIAAELGAGLSHTSYHVRQLKSFGLVRLVKRRMQRGAVEHYYTAVVRPTIPDTAWNRIPEFVRRALVGGKIAQVGNEVTTAANRGGFDREGVVTSRTRLRLSPEGWRKINKEFEKTLERIDAIAEADHEAIARDPDTEIIEATAVHLFFESPSPASFDPAERHPDALDALEDLEDLAPHQP